MYNLRIVVLAVCRPPRRGMWIEIGFIPRSTGGMRVIPRIGGMWIEISSTTVFPTVSGCRPPHRGMWIEIFSTAVMSIPVIVIPRIGGCGLKLRVHRLRSCNWRHPPHRGMWIEMISKGDTGKSTASHPPHMGDVN